MLSSIFKFGLIWIILDLARLRIADYSRISTIWMEGIKLYFQIKQALAIQKQMSIEHFTRSNLSLVTSHVIQKFRQIERKIRNYFQFAGFFVKIPLNFFRFLNLLSFSKIQQFFKFREVRASSGEGNLIWPAGIYRIVKEKGMTREPSEYKLDLMYLFGWRNKRWVKTHSWRWTQLLPLFSK